jgi:hypothetical protein
MFETFLDSHHVQSLHSCLKNSFSPIFQRHPSGKEQKTHVIYDWENMVDEEAL